ncbi:MAG: hypothetical protein JJ896_08480 [Rhodothermales bacterium]|nr:hypothetical protein [Rhodothermales bacterium]MBO6779679.1 hypothetical protein [Rhodothermales bacterium]
MTHRPGIACLAVLLWIGAGCDHGLEPPEEVANGSISGTITYVGEWPPQSQVQDLRFVAMRFVPQDTLDFLQLNRMAISERLAYGVAEDTFTILDVEPGVFVYSGVAQQQTTDILSWRPVGLLQGDGGFFSVEPGQSASLSMTVDFSNLPVFPPDR